jgi:hypothetical protein
LAQRQRGKMVTVNLIGKCTNIQLTPANGEPNHCTLTVQLDRNLAQMLYRPYEVQLVIPVEFAALFQVGHPISIALGQNGD